MLLFTPNMLLIRYTTTDLFTFQQIRFLGLQRGLELNLVTGADEMFICGCVMKSDGGIGSTYNVMPKLFVRLHAAFHAGDTKLAMELQEQINQVHHHHMVACVHGLCLFLLCPGVDVCISIHISTLILLPSLSSALFRLRWSTQSGRCVADRRVPLPRAWDQHHRWHHGGVSESRVQRRPASRHCPLKALHCRTGEGTSGCPRRPPVHG